MHQGVLFCFVLFIYLVVERAGGGSHNLFIKVFYWCGQIKLFHKRASALQRNYKKNPKFLYNLFCLFC